MRSQRGSGSTAGRADGSSTSQAWRARRARKASVLDDVSNEKAKPWAADGISRAWWYRKRQRARIVD